MRRIASPDSWAISLSSNRTDPPSVLEPHHGPGGRRLPAARLADHSEGPAALEREAHAVDGLDRTVRIPIRTGMCTLRSVTSRTRLLSASVRVTSCRGRRRVGGHAAPPSAATGSSSPRLSSSRARWQAATCSGPTCSNGGTVVRQAARPSDSVQRGTNGQPSGTSSRSGGRPGDGEEPFGTWPPAGPGPDQRARVGVPSVGEDRLPVAVLGGRPGIHDEDVVGHLADDAEVGRDEDERAATVGPRLSQHVEDLRLHGRVERGGRLVGDDERRLVDERHGDHGALPHPAGPLVGVLVGAAVGVGDPDRIRASRRPAAGPAAGWPCGRGTRRCCRPAC